MSPHALRQRMRHGNVYPKERAEQALHSFFREGNLNALRELALRKVATTVEQDLEEYMHERQIDASWAASDRVLVWVDEGPEAEHLLRRASQLAAGLQTELIAVFVEPPGRAARAGADARGELAENLRYAEDLGADVVRAQGRDVAAAILHVAREKNAGSIVVGQPRRRGFGGLAGASVVDKLLRLAKDIDVHIVAKKSSG
jgi:two-component system sensor histidine kinase KdpD